MIIHNIAETDNDFISEAQNKNPTQQIGSFFIVYKDDKEMIELNQELAKVQENFIKDKANNNG